MDQALLHQPQHPDPVPAAGARRLAGVALPVAVLVEPHPAADEALGLVGGRGLEGVVVGVRLGAVGASGGGEGQGAIRGAGPDGGDELDRADELERLGGG
jgi:hypothetical protein